MTTITLDRPARPQAAQPAPAAGSDEAQGWLGTLIQVMARGQRRRAARELLALADLHRPRSPSYAADLGKAAAALLV